MKRLSKYFLVGLVTLGPIILTLSVVKWIFFLLDGLLGRYLKNTPYYFTGLGLLITVIVILLIGMITSSWLGKLIFTNVDRLFQKVPGVRMIYSIIKDTINSIFGDKRSFSKVAVIRLPGTQMKLLGFVTSEDLTSLGSVGKDHVAIYILQSMQWAGHTLLVPKEDVEVIDAPVEEVMKFIVSAGITGK